jgi:hypothetical protein
MPPLSMFRARQRPSGLEFANCAECNGGTSGADVVASFFARIRPDNDVEHWQVKEIQQLKASLERKAPGVAHELFREEKNEKILRQTPGGILVPAVQVRADGPLLQSYMTVFTSKMGMALYREHVGEPLPLTGCVHSHWYLNAGLAQNAADTMLRILPLGSGLRQGAFHVDDQFIYRFNCDGRTILAALARFHVGLYVFVIATSNPNLYLANLPDFPTGAMTRPGELAAMIPLAGPRYWR